MKKRCLIKLFDPYISEEEVPLSVEEIQEVLKEYGLLAVPNESTDVRYWPGDKEEKR